MIHDPLWTVCIMYVHVESVEEQKLVLQRLDAHGEDWVAVV